MGQLAPLIGFVALVGALAAGLGEDLFGAPETFVVDAAGSIALKQIGPITPEILDQTILPLVAKLQGESRRWP